MYCSIRLFDLFVLMIYSSIVHVFAVVFVFDFCCFLSFVVMLVNRHLELDHNLCRLRL